MGHTWQLYHCFWHCRDLMKNALYQKSVASRHLIRESNIPCIYCLPFSPRQATLREQRRDHSLLQSGRICIFPLF